MPHAPTDILSRRHTAIRQTLAARGLDALIVTSLPNVTYLTNFSGSAAIVVLAAERLHFITDFRYMAELDTTRGTASACPGLEQLCVESSYDETLATVVTAMGPARLGFEAAHLTVARHRWLESTLQEQAAGGVALVSTEGLVERARVRKDPYEIDTLREAARRLSAVARGLLTGDEVRRGRREREVAMAIDWRIRDAGFERPAFDTIVASGPNAALPHARPGERILTESDLVVLDFGGVYDSYCVDLTRTVSLGADSRAREVYGAVREAHRRAIDAVAPGRSRFEIDAAARDTLARHGLAEAFGHGTGHGLGIEVHEAPRISRRRPGLDDAGDDAVDSGMVFTIEPGAYIPGWGGVRIEDDVLVTGEGVEVLTDVPTELLEL